MPVPTNFDELSTLAQEVLDSLLPMMANDQTAQLVNYEDLAGQFVALRGDKTTLENYLVATKAALDSYLVRLALIKQYIPDSQ